MTVKEVLQQAKGLIDEQGWCQGAYKKTGVGGTVSYCALGAMRTAVGNHYESHEYQVAWRHLLRTINKNSVGAWRNVYGWNDDYRTTKQDVIAAFDQAIRDSIEEELVGAS